MPTEILRNTSVLGAASLTASITTTQKIDNHLTAGGSISLPTGTNITTLTFWGCKTEGGTYLPLNEQATGSQNPRTYVPLVMTVSGPNTYPLPDECFGQYAFAIVTDQPGTADITLKT